MADKKEIVKIDVIAEARKALSAMTKHMGMVLVYQVQNGKPGMLCTKVEPDQAASDGGIVENDFVTHCKIRHLKEKEWTVIKDETSFDSMYTNALPGHTITFKVRRGKFSVRINVRVMAEGKEEWEVYKHANVLLDDDELDDVLKRNRGGGRHGDESLIVPLVEETRDEALAKLNGMKKQLGMTFTYVYGPIAGIKCETIKENQPCEKAGLKTGDVLTHAKMRGTITGWEKLDDPDRFMEIFGRSRPGRIIDVLLFRNDKKKLFHIRVMAENISEREVERLCRILVKRKTKVKAPVIAAVEKKEESKTDEAEEDDKEDEDEDDEEDDEEEDDEEEADEEEGVVEL